ncbi:MAG: polymer-forming cytoskeletal protein [Thermoanaerobaculia bacterium]|nr:polymer-forming cytoskeletal protein [Thermoanaerobaculia bacterium]
MCESNRNRRSFSALLLTALLLVGGLTPALAQESPTEEDAAAAAPAEAQPGDTSAPAAPPAPEVIEPPAEAVVVEGVEERRRTITRDTQVHFMSDLLIAEDEAAREAVAILGDVEVRGEVRGDAVAVMGSVTVSGRVVGTVTAIGDDVRLEAGSEVTGDVVSVGGRIERHPDSQVLGSISEIALAGPAMRANDIPFGWDVDGPPFWDMWHMGIAWELFWTLTKWVLLLIVTSFILLVARGPVERVRRVVEAEFWKAGLIGLVTWLLLFPVLLVATLILAISIIGIPLLLILWPLAIFVLLIACFVGYTATAYALGGWLARRFGRPLTNPYAAMILGVVAIQLLSLIADLLSGMGGPMWFFVLMFALTGWFVRFVAWTVGMGGALLAFADRRRAGPPAMPPAPSGGPGGGGERSPAGEPAMPGSGMSAPPPPAPGGSEPSVGDEERDL